MPEFSVEIFEMLRLLFSTPGAMDVFGTLACDQDVPIMGGAGDVLPQAVVVLEELSLITIRVDGRADLALTAFGLQMVEILNAADAYAEQVLRGDESSDTDET